MYKLAPAYLNLKPAIRLIRFSMRLHLSIVIAFLFCISVLYGQSVDSLSARKDSLTDALAALLNTRTLEGREPVSFWPPRYKPYKRLVFVARLDFRHSFVSAQDIPVTIYGANFGIRYKRRHEFYAGYYTLSNNTRNRYQQRVNNQVFVNNETTEDLDLWFVSLGYAYSFIKTRWIDVNLPLEFGVGKLISDTYTRTLGPQGRVLATRTDAHNNLFLPVQIGVFCEFRFCRWLAATTSIGYRFVINKQEKQSDYESMYYSYGAKVYIGQVVRDLRLLSKKHVHARALQKRQSDVD